MRGRLPRRYAPRNDMEHYYPRNDMGHYYPRNDMEHNYPRNDVSLHNVLYEVLRLRPHYND